MQILTGNMWDQPGSWKVITASLDGEVDQYFKQELNIRHPSGGLPESWVSIYYREECRKSRSVGIWQATSGAVDYRMLVIAVRPTADSPLDVAMTQDNFSKLKNMNSFVTQAPPDMTEAIQLLQALSDLPDNILVAVTNPEGVLIHHVQSRPHGTGQDRTGDTLLTAKPSTPDSSGHGDSQPDKPGSVRGGNSGKSKRGNIHSKGKRILADSITIATGPASQEGVSQQPI